jgi:arsenate reductase
MNSELLKTISLFSTDKISEERKNVLQPMIAYVQEKLTAQETIRLNFICTHNSRRSHLGQIWAQTMAYHFGIKNVYCYSGGTEATAMFGQVAQTLTAQGFQFLQISEGNNPVYAIKYAASENPIICFSKKYNDAFNPSANYAAIITCNNADDNCPIVFGAEQRIPIKYIDPKAFDGTDLMIAKYAERSLEIAQEMSYVFSNIKK